MSSYRLSVLDGVVTLDKKFHEHVKSLKDGQYFVTVQKQKKTRSLNQNGYYFGVVVAMIAEKLGYTPDETHQSLRTQFLSEKHESGLSRIKSTSELSTVEFEKYLEVVRMFASEFLNLYIPLPHESPIPETYNYY
jgi:hypothetical protein